MRSTRDSLLRAPQSYIAAREKVISQKIFAMTEEDFSDRAMELYCLSSRRKDSQIVFQYAPVFTYMRAADCLSTQPKCLEIYSGTGDNKRHCMVKSEQERNEQKSLPVRRILTPGSESTFDGEEKTQKE